MIKNKRVLTLLVPVLAILISLAIYFGAGKLMPSFTPEATASDGGRIISFTIDTFDGPKLTVDDLMGKPLVLNFWGSWCGPCRFEAADLVETYQEFAGKVNFVGIAVQDTEAGARGFVRDFKVTYPNGLDKDDSIMSAYQVYGVPMTVVYDRFGNTHYRHVGAITKTLLSDKLRELF